MPHGIYERKVRPVIIPIGPSIAYLQLSRGKFALIDSDRAKDVGRYNWTAVDTPYGFRAISHVGRGRKFSIYLHRYLMDNPVDFDVDHANGDTLDNRVSNLRWATRSQNCMNKRMHGRLKGISFVPRLNKFKTTIQVSGKSVHLGYYGTPEAAHEAYVEAANRFFGEFARAG